MDNVSHPKVNSPANDPTSVPAYVQLGQDLQSLQLMVQPRLDTLREETAYLGQRVKTLTGLLTFVMIGWLFTSGWLGYITFRQSQIQPVVAEAELSAAEQQRIAMLEQQVEALEARAPVDLALQLQNNREKLQELLQKVGEVEVNSANLKDVQSSIEKLTQSVLQSPTATPKETAQPAAETQAPPAAQTPPE